MRGRKQRTPGADWQARFHRIRPYRTGEELPHRLQVIAFTGVLPRGPALASGKSRRKLPPSHSPMKKFYVIGGILLVLALGLYVGVTFFLGSIVKAGVNRLGPQLTQSTVELSSANLSPLSGSGTLSGLKVGNPKGWSDGQAFYLGKVHVSLEPSSIFGDHVVINEITIDQPEFLYETKFVSSNIKDLLKNIEEFSGSGQQTATTKDGKPLKFVVKKFRLTNGKATLGVGTTTLPVPLPPISLDDVGVKEGGITADQLAGVLMQQVLSDLAAGTANALSKDGPATVTATIEKTKEAAKKAGESLKKLFGDKK